MKITPEEVEKLEAKYKQLSLDTSILKEQHDRLVSQIAIERSAFQKEQEKAASEQALLFKNREMACDRVEAELQVREKAVLGLEAQFDQLNKLSAYIQAQKDDLNVTRQLSAEETERELKIKANNEVVTAQLWKRQVEVDDKERALKGREDRVAVQESEAIVKLEAIDRTERSLNGIEAAQKDRQAKQEEREINLSARATELNKLASELEMKESLLAQANKALESKLAKIVQRESEVGREEKLMAQKKLEALAASEKAE